ncbi:regulator of G-protein signaling 12 [Elysia marginata]|uniref:Regulator of G-protein signaling 12 n=1 Tax=Elysia marginata TaxID=1093978 RepID=A0AAV4HL13_9GAST|nr:regulator of G-protein signaling 12 [Elysia marginata]
MICMKILRHELMALSGEPDTHHLHHGQPAHQILLLHKASLAVGEDPNANNVKLLGACSVNNIASQANDRAGQAQGINKAGRVASWAVNFQNLLSDPVGIEIFTEFLQKEFSEENIIFWKACEQYRQLKDEQQRKLQAQDIYSRYLSSKASDPVNVDSAAKSHTEQFLDSPTTVMFDVAQNQIFQLMRQDSYSRFLKSELYKSHVMDEMAGKPLELPASSAAKGVPEAAQGDGAAQDKKKGKGKENEDKRRRSILPWRNGRKSIKNSTDADSKKANKKNKDEKDKEQQQKEQQQQQQQQPNSNSTTNNNLNTSTISGGSTNSLHANVGGGNSSSAGNMKKAPGPGIDLSTMRKEVFHPKDSQEVSESQFKFCRIVMPDGSTTVVSAKPGQSTRFVLGKLCEKRSISLASVDVFLLGSDRLLDLNEDISQLGSKEIIIEPRVMFRLDMPSGKSIGVKAKPNRSIRDVFRPIMHKYGYRMESISVRLMTSQEFLDLDVAVSELDKQRALIVCSNPDVADWVRRGGMPGPVDMPPAPRASTAERPPQSKGSAWRGGSLEEITNKIFEDLMRGKSQLAHGFDELGVLELDKPKAHKNEEGRSSGLFGLLRKESMGARDNHKNKMKGKVTFALPLSESKKKSNAKEGERLFELLSSAQSLRIEEQRGVHISPCELPSFLAEDKNKNSEANQQHSEFETLAAQQQLFDDVSEISRAGILEKKAWRKTSNSFQENFPPTPRLSTSTPRGTKYGAKTMAVTPLLGHSDQSFSQDGVIPTPDEAEAFFRMSPMIVDSRLTAMGMSLDGALELRNGDKYPENEMGRIGKTNFSRTSGRHAFQPLHSPPGQRARAPVASPEKFSPLKKKQRNSPENMLESSDGNFSFAPRRDNLTTFSPSSMHSGPGYLSSTPRQNISHLDHSLAASVYHGRSPSTTMSPPPSSHTQTPMQQKSPTPHAMTSGPAQRNTPPPHPTYAKGFPQSHSRPASAPNKNRLSDGMLIHKLQQAQSQKESINPDLSNTIAGNTTTTRSSFTHFANSQSHSESTSSSSQRKSPDANHANLAQRALLSPRFDNSPFDRAMVPPHQATPSQRALLSPRFEQVRISERENREPSFSQNQMGGTVMAPKKNYHYQIGGAFLSPRYSKGSPFQAADSAMLAQAKYQVSDTLPTSSLPVPVTSLTPQQSNIFPSFPSKHFASPVPHSTHQLQGEETVTFV